MSIDQINTDLASAEATVRSLREQRASALVAACPHKVGDTFETGGRQYIVRSVSAGGKGKTVYLHCGYRVSSGQWSRGSKVISHEVEG